MMMKQIINLYNIFHICIFYKIINVTKLNCNLNILLFIMSFVIEIKIVGIRGITYTPNHN